MSEHLSSDACEYPDEMLSDLVNGELDGADKRRVAVHAASCARCAQVLGGLFATRAALSVPDPGKLSLPRAFWGGVRSRLDEVDGLIRATNGASARRPAWVRPAFAIGLAAIVLLCIGRVAVVLRPDSVTRVAEMHLAATAPLGDPGLHQAVGYSPVSQWRPRQRSLANLNGHMVMQTVYDVDGLPVSVFRLPHGALDERKLVHVIVAQESVYLGALQSSSLAAIPSAGAWDVIVARTPADDLLRLTMARPRGVQVDPGL